MIEKVIKQYKLRFENLKLENIDSLMEVVDSKITFEDPFNRIVGKDKLTKVFYLMFEKLKRPKFKVIEIFYKGNVAIIKWKFSCIMLKKEITNEKKFTLKILFCANCRSGQIKKIVNRNILFDDYYYLSSVNK